MRCRKEREEVKKQKGTKGDGDKNYSMARIKIFTDNLKFLRHTICSFHLRTDVVCRRPLISLKDYLGKFHATVADTPEKTVWIVKDREEDRTPGECVAEEFLAQTLCSLLVD